MGQASFDEMLRRGILAVVGPVSFREDGTGIVNAPILQYQNGKIELVYPPEFATADLVYPAPAFSDRTEESAQDN